MRTPTFISDRNPWRQFESANRFGLWCSVGEERAISLVSVVFQINARGEDEFISRLTQHSHADSSNALSRFIPQETFALTLYSKRAQNLIAEPHAASLRQ